MFVSTPEQALLLRNQLRSSLSGFTVFFPVACNSQWKEGVSSSEYIWYRSFSNATRDL